MGHNATEKRLTLTMACIAAAISGAVLYSIFLDEPQSHLGEILGLGSLLCLTFGTAFVLTLFKTPHRLLIPCALLSGFVAVHSFVVAGRWRAGSYSSRWPLEFGILAVFNLPAFWATGLNIVPAEMNLKRHLFMDCFRALLAASLITALCLQWLMHSNDYHGVAVTILGPAYDIICHHLDPECYGVPSHEFEVLAKVLALNVLLYWFWIGLGLCSMDVIRYGRYKRRLACTRTAE